MSDNGIIIPQKKLIDITDIYDQRNRKKKELEFYTTEMEKLMRKLARLNHEIGVTETIISLIEQETVLDLKETIEEKRKLLKDD
tara:strand:- start:7113 stop:7364 length:252 start_codon:yes stop_codon:yes gene_type:complete